MLLKKEAEHYQVMLRNIHNDLYRAQQELENTETQPPSSQTIKLLSSLMSDLPTVEWKYMFSGVNCGLERLSTGIRLLIERRNELFTYYSKFEVSETC